MFCSKCGTQNPDDSKFCAGCGAALDEGNSTQATDSSQSHMPQAPLIDDLPEIDISSGSGLHCPKCKSEKIQALTETDVQGGYQAGRGCLGYLLFGPLGFLCGALGKKAKITSTNNTMFVCMECGFKYKPLEDMIAEKEAKMRLSIILGIVFIMILIWLGSELDSILSLIIGILIAISPFGMFLLEKEARDDLRKNGYDAACYLKEDKK